MRLSTLVLSVVFVLGGCGNDGSSAAGGGAGSGGAGGVSGSINPLEGIGDVELVADGFDFTEGPTWRDATGTLLFSDLFGNAIYELAPPDSVAVFRENSSLANGLASDGDGLLLTAETLTRRVSRTLADGTVVDLVSDYMGDRFHSPNDIEVRSDGMIYFTDPPFVREPDEREIDFNGVFRVDGAGGITAEWQGEESTRPNGLVLSPDESILYVADTSAGVMAFDVDAAGSLSSERTFVAEVPSADGMAIDAAGNLFVAAEDGVRVYSTRGDLWGTIETPNGNSPANCAFGGADARRLYITARDTLYAVTLANPGLL